MIQYIRDLLREGLDDIRRFSQLQLALLLVLLIPIVLLFSANTFLTAGTTNQDHLQQQSIHTIHQSLHTLTQSLSGDIRNLQSAVELLPQQNDELSHARVLIRQGSQYVVVASDQRDEVNSVATDPDSYQQLSPLVAETVHELRDVGGVNYWRSMNSAVDRTGRVMVTETWYDRSISEQVFLTAVLQAYIAIIVVFILIVGIAYWHIRSSNYYDLYNNARDILANQQRFTQMITHELRAPLTAVRGYASMLLEDKDLTKNQQKQVTQIKRSSERVLSIVAELLEIAQIQSGRISVQIENVDLSELVTETLHELRPLTEGKQISLTQSGVLHAAVVQSDPGRLQQILVNLVSNAIKYSERGRIEIEIRHLRQGYELRVKDTGLGISAENQRKLFAPFFRVQDQNKFDALGVGLGMWITRQYIDVLGAKVEVESVKDVGTRIVITVPKAYSNIAENQEEV